jgi:hypothetical protein
MLVCPLHRKSMDGHIVGQNLRISGMSMPSTNAGIIVSADLAEK